MVGDDTIVGERMAAVVFCDGIVAVCSMMRNAATHMQVQDVYLNDAWLF
jgi:hypothetical protein